jgi:glycosyltransferase involved in cell wall biosynthesis
MITFSIIIPTYNQLPLLKRALESVLHQQGADYEVIVTDDSNNEDISTYIQ